MVRFNRKKPSGNIYWILGQATTELREQGRAEDAETMCHRVYQSDSYEAALKIVSEYVEIAED